MTDQLISNHPRQRVINIDAAVAWIMMFFMLLFAIWTLAHHAATFFGIPWQVLSFGSAVIGLPAAFLAARGAQQFSLVYAREVENVPFPTGLQGASSALLLVTITALLLITPTYSLRFFIALFGFSLMWWL